MTPEEKQLLLKDLCARLPYSIWGLHRDADLQLYVIDNYGAYMVLGYDAWFNLETVPFKPYLRPISSMTEDEGREFEETLQYTQYTLESYDWLNKHYFDYRGLIEKGLALEAPEGMYKIKSL